MTQESKEKLHSCFKSMECNDDEAKSIINATMELNKQMYEYSGGEVDINLVIERMKLSYSPNENILNDYNGGEMV